MLEAVRAGSEARRRIDPSSRHSSPACRLSSSTWLRYRASSRSTAAWNPSGSTNVSGLYAWPRPVLGVQAVLRTVRRDPDVDVHRFLLAKRLGEVVGDAGIGGVHDEALAGVDRPHVRDDHAVVTAPLADGHGIAGTAGGMAGDSTTRSRVAPSSITSPSARILSTLTGGNDTLPPKWGSLNPPSSSNRRVAGPSPTARRR